MTTTSFAPSSRLPRRLPRDDGTITAVVADPDTTTTTTTTTLSIPSPLPTSPQPGAFAPGGASSPSLLAGCISIAAFASAFVLICVWCRFRGSAGSDAINRFLDRVLPARFRRRTVDDDDEEVQEVQEQEEREGGVGGGGGPPGPPEPEEQVHIWRRLSSRRSRRSQTRASRRRKARPEMFDAWIEKTDDASRWEAGGSLPLSATVFPMGSHGPSGENAEVSSRVGAVIRDSVHEEEDEEKRRSLSVQTRQAVAAGSGTLQVAVLLQMPSPPPPLPPPSHNTATEDQSDISVRRELVIGLVEAPWTGEHPSSREGEETTTS